MMLKIEEIRPDQIMWDETIAFAENCSWAAGRLLADRMRANDFSDWERVIVASDGGRVVGFSAFEKKGRVPPEYDFTPFINLVFVDENYRGNRISEKMIRYALSYAAGLGFKEVYLKSEHRGLYEKYGFEKVADFVPVQGRANQLFKISV